MIKHYTGNDLHESVHRGHFALTGFEGFRSEASTMVIDPHTAFQSHLLAELMKFRGVPLAAYDSVMDTLRFWSLEMQLDFNRRDIYRSRKSLLHHLKKVYHMQNFSARMENIDISHGRKAGVVIFDTVEVITNMLSDRRIFCEENIASGYDIWTGLGEDSGVYGEYHTGSMWKVAHDRYIAGTDNFALPLVVFYDKTHTDVKSALTSAPVMIHFAFLNLTTRKKTYVAFPIRII
jgi:hypothetical protein